MNAEELKLRTKKFALRVIKLYRSLPKEKDARFWDIKCCDQEHGRCKLRAACRARSQADFISKITIVEEEPDETSYWLELLIESGIMKKELLNDLMKESNELTAIFTSSGIQQIKNNPQSKIRIRI